MKQSTKRLVSFTVALVSIFASIFVFLNFVQPSYSEAQAIKNEYLSKISLFSIQQKSVKAVQDLIMKTKQAGEADYATQISFALPQTRDESGLVYEINQLASQNHLSPQSITVSTPGVQNTGASSPKVGLVLVKPVNKINVQTRLSGTYADFKAFLANLETNIRIMDIASMSVSPAGKPNQDFYLFDISVVAYYQNI